MILRPTVHSFGPYTATFLNVFKGRREQVLKPAELKELRDLATQTKELHRQISLVSIGQAKNDRLDAVAAYQSDPSPENFARVKELSALDGATLTKRHENARHAIKDVLRSIAPRAGALLDTVRSRAADLLEAEALTLEKEEAALAARVGIPAEGGLYSGALRNLIRDLRKPCLFGSGCNPLDLLKPLIKDLET